MSVTYRFPRITHIDDVLRHVSDGCFKIVEKDTGHTFINYVMMGNDVFPLFTGDPVEDHRAAIRRECRGIAFDTATGALVSRPFHKFFNVGEREDMDIAGEIFNSDLYISDKVDGSMLRPLPTAAGIRWGTKMGVTDTALFAEEFVAGRPEYDELAAYYMQHGFTPLFEYVSRKNRIVVDYAEENMILLAVRNNVTGGYLLPDAVANIAERFGIDSVRMYPAFAGAPNVGALAELVRGSNDFDEGIVLQWENGHRAKVKTETYSRMHRAKEATRTERTLAILILAEGADDLIPMLGEEDKKMVTRYITRFFGCVKRLAEDLGALYKSVRRDYGTKKDFAVSDFAKGLTSTEKSTMFAMWDGKRTDSTDAAMQIVSMGLSSESSWEAMKQTIAMSSNLNTFDAGWGYVGEVE